MCLLEHHGRSCENRASRVPGPSISGPKNSRRTLSNGRNQLVNDLLASWIEYGPSLEAERQFWITVIATAFVLGAAWILAPYFAHWNSRRWQKTKARSRREEQLTAQWKAIKWRPSNEDERRQRDGMLEIVRKRMVWLVPTLIVLAAVMYHLGVDVLEGARTTEVNRRQIDQMTVNLVDDISKGLWQKTQFGDVARRSCEEKHTHQRRVSEVLCRERAIIDQGGNGVGPVTTQYRLCMLDRGWLTRPCECESTGDNCVMLAAKGTDCPVNGWQTDDLFWGPMCLDDIRDDVNQGRAELHCVYRAHLYSMESWYDGLTDIERLQGSIYLYQICMDERGYSTQPCGDSDTEREDCVQIIFEESICLKDTRDWLAGKLKRRPCQETPSWALPRRHEPDRYLEWKSYAIRGLELQE